MSEIDLPQGHVRIDGRHYVAFELFEAANRHVLEQGVYANQLIGTLNDQGSVIRKQEAERLQLMRDLHSTKAELTECQRTQQVMRKAVYGAAEGV